MTAGSPLSTAHLPRPDAARGVFETLLVVAGRAVELDAHLERLAASARELFGAPAMARIAGPARALAEARAAELGEPLARMRLTLSPDAGGALDLSASVAQVDRSTVFPPSEHSPTLRAVAVPGGLGAHKWADRRLLDAAAAQLDGALPLIVDGDGGVLETERANVFAVQDGVLTTPPADGRILPGVARARVKAIAGELGIELRELPLTLAGLDAADEAFLTGSVRGLEPLRAPDPGGGAARIAAALRERWLGPA